MSTALQSIRDTRHTCDTASVEWHVGDTLARLIVTEPTLLGAAERIACDVIETVDAACNRARPDSELSLLTPHLAEGVWVGETLALLLRCALDAAETSRGAVDPTVVDATAGGPTVGDPALGDPALGDPALGDPALGDPALGNAAHGVGVGVGRDIRRAVWTQGRFVRVAPGLTLDLAVTAKAVTADLIAQRVARECGCGVMVTLGDDIATAGPAPRGGAWLVVVPVAGVPRDSLAPVALPAGWGLATATTAGVSAGVTGVTAGATGRLREPQARDVPRMSVRQRPTRAPKGVAATSPWRSVSVAAPTCLEAMTVATTALLSDDDPATAVRRMRRPTRFVACDGMITPAGGWPANPVPGGLAA